MLVDARPSITSTLKQVTPWVATVAGTAFAIYGISLSWDAALYPFWADLFVQPVGLFFLYAGLFLWLRQPESTRMGLLLFAMGSTWYIGDLQFSQNQFLFTLGFWFFHLNATVLAHLLLAEPEGELKTTAERITIGALYLSTVGIQGARVLAEDPLQPQIWGDPDAEYSIFAPIGSVVAAVLIAAMLVHVWLRWHRSKPAERKDRRLYWFAVASIGVVLLISAFVSLFRASIEIQAVMLVLYACAMLLVGLAALLGPLQRLQDHRRMIQIFLYGPNISMRDKLAQALHDETLMVHYPRGNGEYVDELGHPAPLPDHDSGLTPIELNGAVAFVLSHDSYLHRPRQRERLDAAVAVAKGVLALDDLVVARENIKTIELNTLQAVKAALHDETMNDLAVHGAKLVQLKEQVPEHLHEQIDALENHLEKIAGQFRGNLTGIVPAMLERFGLAAAIDDLVSGSRAALVIDVVDKRWALPQEHDMYLIIREAVGNANKHTDTKQIQISVFEESDRLVLRVKDNGSGVFRERLEGNGMGNMRYRAGKHRGELTIESFPRQHPDDPNGGTTVEVHFPLT